MNTHAAFLKSAIPGEKDLRLAAGRKEYCQMVLASLFPDADGEQR